MMNSINNILQQHPLFNELHPLESQLLNSFKLRTFKKNDVIYRPGIEAQYAYLIVNGSIKFEFSSSSGQQFFVGMVDKNFVIGELELLSGIEYHSTATANEKTSVILIPKNTLLTLIAQKPDFAMKFTKQLATNFYFFQLITAEKEASNLESRLANLLISIAMRFGEKKGRSITIDISQDEISNMLNASRQRVNMQLNEWQKNGIVQCNYGLISITDIESFSKHSGLANSIITEENIAPYQ